MGSPSLSSGTPWKLKDIQAWRARGREEIPQSAQPFCGERPWVCPSLSLQRTPPGSPSAGPLACAPLGAARLLAPAAREPPRGGLRRRGSRVPGRAGPGLTRRAPPGAGSRESGSPRVAVGGWMRPRSGRECPSGRRQCSPSLTHAPLGLSARGGHVRGGE